MMEQRVPTVSGEVIEPDAGMLTAEERQYVTATETGLHFSEGTPYDVWEALTMRLIRVEKHIHWALADALNFGERAYGEKYAQVLDATGWHYQTAATVARVGRSKVRGAARICPSGTIARLPTSRPTTPTPCSSSIASRAGARRWCASEPRAASRSAPASRRWRRRCRPATTGWPRWGWPTRGTCRRRPRASTWW